MGNQERQALVIQRLQHYSYRFTEKADTVQISLPLFCGVQVVFSPENSTITPRFGRFRRTQATWMSLIVFFAAAITLVLAETQLPSTISFKYLLAILGLSALIWNCYLFVMTEHLISRLYLWMEKTY